jgi:hypothetical protein
MEFYNHKLDSMKFVRLLVSFAFLLLLSASAESAVYYVDSNGNDSNDGLSASTPWKTIVKVNSIMSSLTAGSQILFKRGDTFYGMIMATKSGTAGNEIVFGSYGTGNLPVVTGVKAVIGWTVHSGNIYSANISDTISHLFANGKLMTVARFPNSRFLKCDYANSTVAFDDAELTQPAGYWNQATCRVRTGNWCYESRTVSGYSAGHIDLSSAVQNIIYPKAGYYFDNRLALLDTANEYFYDKAAGKLYFYAPGGVDPNTIQVEAVTTRYGFLLANGLNNVIVQDIEFSKFRENCVEIYTASNVRVQRCKMNNAGKSGLRINGSNNVVDNNIIEDNMNTGITGVFTNCTVSNNLVNRTALVPGYAENSWGGHGIQFYLSTGTVCLNNVIDSSGYTGMLVSKNMLVKNNVVSNSCMTLNDGGGIDLDDADGMQILDNIVINSFGNVESSYSLSKYANGIYFGPNVTKNVLIKGNTIANNSYVGINVDNKATSANNQIINNILYNNAYSQIVMTDYSSTSYTPSYNNLVKGNLFYCLSNTQTGMEHQMFRSPSFSDYGTFDSNYYSNPYTEHFMRRSMVYGTYATKYYRLSTWKNLFNEDLTSGTSSFVFDQYRVLDTLSSNMILNPRFTTDVVNWSTTPPSGSTITRTVNPLLDTGCMKIRWNGSGGPEGMTSCNYITLTKNNYYHLRFDYAGNHPGDFSTFGRPNSGANPFLFARRYLGIENYKRSFNFVFKPDTTEPNARVTFAMSLPDTTVSIDNVYLYRVNVERIDSTLKNRLFYNPTSSVQVISLGGVPFKNPDGTSVTGSITLQPFTSRILVNDENVIRKHLSLTMLVQGLYDPVAGRMKNDSVKVFLRNASSPFAVVDSAVAEVDSMGNSEYYFMNAVNGVNYYISLRHTNSLETWSGSTISFSSNEGSYSFSNDISKAFGNNMILSGSKYCIYSGDVNQDGTIDATDAGTVANDASNYVVGNVVTDLTGDNYVDGTDFIIANNNSENYVTVLRP